MSLAMSAARVSSSSIVSKSINKVTESDRTLSWPRLSIHSGSSAGKSTAAIRSARPATPSSEARYVSDTNGLSL